MVCIYCGSPTSVVNSRPQKRANNIWRRRSCTMCGAVFTTTEQPDLEHTIMVEYATTTHLLPFSRDQLFISIFESCKHRPTALQDATSLTATIIQQLLTHQAHTGIITRRAITQEAYRLLELFDHAAATFYNAYHPAR